MTGRAVFDRRTVHIFDLAAEDGEFPEGSRHARLTAIVPRWRHHCCGRVFPIGAILFAATEVRPFTEKQIELVTTFADQAVIAIENVRLFDDVQKRTDDLTESLEQQTATVGGAQGHLSSPASWSRCLRPCWRMRRASAKPSSVYSGSYEGDAFRMLRCTVCRRICRIRVGRASVFQPHPDVPLADRCTSQADCRFARFSDDRSLPRRRSSGVGLAESGRRPHAANRADAQGRRARSARSLSTAKRCARSPTSKSSW